MALWRHFAYNFREGGVRQILRKISWRVRQRLWSNDSWLVYDCDLSSFRGEPKLPLTSSVLDFETLVKLGYFKASAFPELIKKRFDAGALCRGFFLEGEFANIGWTLRDTLEVESGVNVGRSGCGSIYDCFTFAEHRGKGIYTDALIRMLNDLRAEGARTALIAVDPANLPSIRAIEKVGFQPLYRLTRRRRFGRQSLEEQAFMPRFARTGSTNSSV